MTDTRALREAVQALRQDCANAGESSDINLHWRKREAYSFVVARLDAILDAYPEASEPTTDSRKHGDPVNLTPYIWPTLRMYTTEAERLEWGISEDRSMQLNLVRFADQVRRPTYAPLAEPFPHELVALAQPAPVVAAPAGAPTLVAIGEQLRTQDNACTADPMFVVQQRRRIYGFDDQYIDDIAWLYEDETVEATEQEARELEAEYGDTFHVRDGWRRVAYVDTWEFVTVCLTRSAAERYIERQRHNLRDPRVYVESGHRNPEWIALRAELKALPAEPSGAPEKE